MPPLGCIDSARGVRLCVTDEPEKVIPEPRYIKSSGPHPATLVKPPVMYRSIGQQVKFVDLEQSLPSYFEIKKSQAGFTLEGEYVFPNVPVKVN